LDTPRDSLPSRSTRTAPIASITGSSAASDVTLFPPATSPCGKPSASSTFLTCGTAPATSTTLTPSTTMSMTSSTNRHSLPACSSAPASTPSSSSCSISPGT